MKHRFISWVVFILSVVPAVWLLFLTIQNANALSHLVWRPYALTYVVAFICSVALLGLLIRSNSRKGPIYWFIAFVFMNLLWTLSLFFMTTSGNPEQGAFWQAMSTLGWIVPPSFLFFFVLTYLDDTDLPSNLMLWITPLCIPIILTYISGATNLVEPHSVVEPSFSYFGYESRANDAELLIFVWVFLVTIIAMVMLWRAYRRTSNILRKRQIRIFLIALSQYILIELIFDALLGNLLPPDLIVYIPIASPIANTILALIIGYGILRYGIFQINPTSLSNTILQSLSEAVFGLDKDLKIEFANAGAETILGYPQEQLKGKSIGNMFDRQVYTSIREQIKTGKRYFEIDDTQAKTVSSAAVDVTLSVGQVFDERNRLAGYIMVIANITALKRKTIELAKEKASVERKVKERTRELSEVHARLTASIDSLNLGFLMTGDNDELLMINPAAKKLMVEFAKSQKLPVPEKWTLKDVSAVFKAGTNLGDALARSRTSVQPFDFEELQLVEHFVHLFLAPVTENGQVIGTVVLFEDITDEKALARSRDEFFSIASHELRTPLTLIRGNTELIRDYYKESITSDEVVSMLSDIENSSTRLIQIVNDFLDMSSLEQGKVKLRVEPFDIVALGKEIIDEFKRGTKKPAIAFKLVAPANPITMSADRARINQVIFNLISNANKFTEKGNITLKIEDSADKVKLWISDTGKGIKIENQGLLFRKFQQAGTSLLTRDGEGTGLGLYITKLLTNAMNGTVVLEKSVEGEGTSFCISLPKESVVAPAQDTPAPAGAPAPTKAR